MSLTFRAYTALARHYREGEVWDKAVTYLSQAGVQAALQHLPERSGRRAVELRLSLRDSLYTLGESRRTLQPLREAEALAEALGDQLLLGRISARLTTYFRVWDDLDRALEWGLRALTLADATGDFGLQVVSNVALAQVYHARGRWFESSIVHHRFSQSRGVRHHGAHPGTTGHTPKPGQSGSKVAKREQSDTRGV